MTFRVDTVEAIIPVYGEKAQALRATTEALAAQSIRLLSRIHIIDDGTEPAVVIRGPLVQLARLPKNVGIAAARNTGLGIVQSEFVACVNVEVCPEPTWLENCLNLLRAHPKAAAVYGRLEVPRAGSLLAQWFLRFHNEPNYPSDRECAFAPGHAVVFRTEALRAVGGYAPELRRIGEDFEVCQRLRAAGHEIWYCASASAVCHQEMSISHLAYKDIVRAGWDPAGGASRLRILGRLVQRCLTRMARDTLKLRWQFLPLHAALLIASALRLGGLSRQPRPN